MNVHANSAIISDVSVCALRTFEGSKKKEEDENGTKKFFYGIKIEMWSVSLDSMPLAFQVENTQLETDTLDHYYRHRSHSGHLISIKK